MNQPVVNLHEVESGIVQLTMQDKVNKNTFSDELIEGLLQAFETIHNNSNYKVVILTGYDSYFATGGTKDRLLDLHDGKFTFSDVKIHSMALDCEIPVISAMQGHAIGGGFTMGLLADFVIFSRESIYTANYMKYGFTPGLGATFILPEKLGVNLATELLFTAETYRGATLEKRGISFPVLPRAEVLNHALQLAQQIAEKPRVSLITLKDHIVGPYREQLPLAIEKEVAMHKKTIHQPEVKDRIEKLFGA